MTDKRKRRIAQRRKQLHLSQEYLASLIDSSQSQISEYERGNVDPTGEVWESLADALNTTVDYLLGRTDNPERPLRGELDLDEVEREVIKILRSKPAARRKQIVEIVKLA